MVLANKIIFHIPEKTWMDNTLVDIPAKRLIKSLTNRLQDTGCVSFYATQAESFYKNRTYPEKLITLYCPENYEQVINAFKAWFKENNSELHQESFAYEYNNLLYIEEL